MLGGGAGGRRPGPQERRDARTRRGRVDDEYLSLHNHRSRRNLERTNLRLG
jgi:hypothetical protein